MAGTRVSYKNHLDGGGRGFGQDFIRSSGTMHYQDKRVLSSGAPGKMYGWATKALGFKRVRHEGKVTGLAVYGRTDAASGTHGP